MRHVTGLSVGAILSFFLYAMIGTIDLLYNTGRNTDAIRTGLGYGLLGFLTQITIFIVVVLPARSRLDQPVRTGILAFLLSTILLATFYALYFVNNNVLSGIPWYTWKSLSAAAMTLAMSAFLGILAFRLMLHGREPSRLGFFSVAPWILFVVLFFSFVFLLSQTSQMAKAPREKGEFPNIILIVLDAVRRDSVSIYGYVKGTTPTIDGMAQEGTLFWDAHSVSSWTLPSVTSLLTSRIPASELEPATFSGQIDAPTLSEILGSRGYTTLAVSSNPHIGSLFKIGSRFHHFHDGRSFYRRSLTYTAAGKVADRLLPVSDQHLVRYVVDHLKDIPQPFFLYLHLMGGHAPYKISDETEPGIRSIEFPTTALNITDIEKKWLFSAYIDQIRRSDALVQEIQTSLKLNLMDSSTLLVITSDHGEEFGEHGDWMHGKHLFRESIEVPLIFWWPGHIPAGKRRLETVTLLDLTPTILAALPLRVDRAGFQGRDLAVRQPTASLSEMPVFAELAPNLRCIITKRWKYISDDERGEEWLFDRVKDHSEIVNLAKKKKNISHGLHSILQQFYFQAVPAIRRGTPLTPAQIEELKSLGYLE